MMDGPTKLSMTIARIFMNDIFELYYKKKLGTDQKYIIE